MTAASLTQLRNGINQQINNHETLDIQLRQADALVRIGAISDFDQISNETAHYYFDVVTDIIEKAVQMSELLSQELSHLASQVNDEIK